MALKLDVTEVRVSVWNSVRVMELLVVVSVLLGRIPVTESPSVRLVASLDTLLEVLEVDESGDSRVVDAAALGLEDAAATDGAADNGGSRVELDGVEQVEQSDVVA